MQINQLLAEVCKEKEECIQMSGSFHSPPLHLECSCHQSNYLLTQTLHEDIRKLHNFNSIPHGYLCLQFALYILYIFIYFINYKNIQFIYFLIFLSLFPLMLVQLNSEVSLTYPLGVYSDI